MTIERICSGEVFLARPDEPVQEAGDRMRVHNVGMLVVVDDDKQPIGIVTDRDLALRVVGEGRPPRTTPVFEIMTRKPKTLPIDTAIEDCLDMMRYHGVRRLPALGRDGKLCGVVTLDDILALLADELAQASRLLEMSMPSRDDD